MENRRYYLPKQTLSFPDGSRIHLDKAYGYISSIERDATLAFKEPRSFQREEAKQRALYLRTLSRMLADAEGAHGTINAEHLYANPVDTRLSYGSQAHLVRMDFERLLEKYGEGLHLGGNESTTRYQSYYNFIDKEFESPAEHKVSNAMHAWDMRAMDMLEKHHVERASFKNLGKDFLALADVADHDYLHQLVNHRHDAASDSIGFAASGHRAPAHVVEKKLGKTTGSTREDLTLSLHAQILARLFKDSPARKAQVLTFAARAFGQLGEMQQQALADCNTDEERRQVNEAITYFTELTAHRLFRIFSPDSAALNEKTATGASVAEAAAALTLLTPQRLLTEHHLENAPKGLAQLELNCSHRLGETYRAIHTIDSFPMEIKTGFAGYQPGIIEPTALEALYLLSKAAALESGPGYMDASREAADKVREAKRLRAEPDPIEAIRLEAGVRGPGRPVSAQSKTPSR